MGLPETGSSIGHFEILERLGGGGMGVVYKARDRKLGRLVALKLMLPAREENAEARLRFLREARAVAALDHPNVCTLFEIGEEEDGRIFLVMAFCPGETLRERLRRGPLPPREAVQVALQVADGLAAAHARGIVHRDIKPANLLLSDGLVKIIDFGVARLADHAAITREGVAIGTLNYTAPEHLFGDEPGPESDLWSLGVVLYESLAGRLPFQAKTLPEMAATLLKSSPPPLEGISPELCRIVERALARSPRQRYQSAEDMQADLLAAMASVTESTLESLVPTEATGARPLGAPVLHNLPFPPLGDLFKGRAEDLASLDEAHLQSHVLHGLGGIGKTRLAVEHAWQHGRRYRAVLFVLADSPDGLNRGLASLSRADLLDLPERNDPAESEVKGAVLRWLRDHSGWLLILDNVDTQEALLAVTRLLPSLTAGRVLITSRRRDWPPGVNRKSLDVIPMPAATDFLLKRTAKDRRRETDDAAQALQLAELLNGLPLALEQAAAYISHTQISISEYLEIWEKECDSVLSWHDEGVMQYPASLAVTWQGSFHQLAPTAQALLRLVAYMAPDPIPAEMLEVSAEIARKAVRLCVEPGDATQSRPLRHDLAELAALSLISRQGTDLAVHRVVQEVIRQRIPEGDRIAWIETAISLVVEYTPFQTDDPTYWPVLDALRSHMSHLLAHASQQRAPESLSLAQLQTCLGIFLYSKSLYSDAEPLLRNALETDKRLFGEHHHEVAVDMLNLANLLKDTDRLEESEVLLRKGMQILQASSANQHPLICKALNGLALLLMKMHRWDEAESFLRHALKIDQTEHGDEHATIGRDLHNLTILLTSTGRASEAYPLILHSIAISQTVHGMAHPITARRLQIQAGMLRDQNRLPEAKLLLEESLSIFEQILGPDHPSTQSARRDLENLTAPGQAPAG
jgi:serine/threonine protein kinase/tetratricopeptide (TPR) repeat protein